MSAMELNIAGYVSCTSSEGPGDRFAIWMQGCLKRCPGCCNPGMLEIAPHNILSCAELVSILIKAKKLYDIEGITILGGEPFIQARGLSHLAEQCRNNDLTVMAFTGYTQTELSAFNLPGTSRLLKHIDVLVDGSFQLDNPEVKRNWVGSANQKFYYLTGAYTPEIETDPLFRRSDRIPVEYLKLEIFTSG